MRPRFQFNLRRVLLAVPFVALAGLVWKERPSYIPLRDQVLVSVALLLVAAGIVARRTAASVAAAMIVWCVLSAII